VSQGHLFSRDDSSMGHLWRLSFNRGYESVIMYECPVIIPVITLPEPGPFITFLKLIYLNRGNFVLLCSHDFIVTQVSMT
jgi:hypothetical protein